MLGKIVWIVLKLLSAAYNCRLLHLAIECKRHKLFQAAFYNVIVLSRYWTSGLFKAQFVVTMVTKVHAKERWSTSSPVSAILKLSKSFPSEGRISGSPRCTKNVSFSPQVRRNTETQSKKKVTLYGWVKPGNPRRSVPYEVHHYHCWVGIVRWLSGSGSGRLIQSSWQIAYIERFCSLTLVQPIFLSWKCCLIFTSAAYIWVRFRLILSWKQTLWTLIILLPRSSLIWVHIVCNIGYLRT